MPEATSEPVPDPTVDRQALERLQFELDRSRQEVELLRTMQAQSAELVERVNMVTRLSRELNQLDLVEIARTCIEKVSHLLKAKFASLYLYNYQADELSLLRASHPHELDDKISIFSDEYRSRVMAHALREKRILLIRDFDQYQQLWGVEFDRPFSSNYSGASAVCTPLFAGSHLVGVLNFADRRDGTPFDEMNDLPIIEQLSQLIGIAIRNHQLFAEVQRQARMDAMTQLLNHSAFFEELQRETKRVNRYGGDLCLLYFDVDNFKGINDGMGHLTGDHVIKEVARMLRENVRTVDIPARYGGDEYVCVLPNTPLQGALVIARRLHARFVANQFDYDGNQFSITVSMGVGEHHKGMTAKDLINSADAGLYRAKEAGKNQVRHSGEVESEGAAAEEAPQE